MNPIESFLEYLRAERRYSALTVRAYGDDIREFVRFCTVHDEGAEGSFDPRCVQADDLRAWIMALSEGRGDPRFDGVHPMAARSINRKLSSIKSFYRYLRKTGRVEVDPFLRIASLKTPVRLPSFVEESRMHRLAQSLMLPTDDFTLERDAVVVLLFYATGIRLAELVGIQIDDFSDGFTMLRVRGKGDKERVVPVIEPVAERIRHYRNLVLGQNICKDRNKYLFLTQQGSPIGRSEVYRIVHMTLRSAGVQGKCSPHVLRHTFATHLLDHGVDMRVIQELLGHASLETTQVYTHNSIAKLKEVYNTAHPRAKKDKED